MGVVLNVTAPELGPCRCGPDHEHSDFDPYPCADCGCEAHQPAATAAGSPAEPSDRPCLTIPAAPFNFATQRVEHAAHYLDQILATNRCAADPDEPTAVCGLADLIEHNWPDGLDPLDVIALTTRRLMDATNRTPTARVRGTLRRMRQQ